MKRAALGDRPADHVTSFLDCEGCRAYPCRCAEHEAAQERRERLPDNGPCPVCLIDGCTSPSCLVELHSRDAKAAA